MEKNKNIKEQEVKIVRMVPVHKDPIAVPPLKYDELIRQSERLAVIERLITGTHTSLDRQLICDIMGVSPKKKKSDDSDNSDDYNGMYDTEEAYVPSVEKGDIE